MNARTFAAAAVLAVVTAALPISASAEIIRFEAFLLGANEAPENASPGSGYGFLVWDTVAQTATYDVSFQDLMAGTTAAHTHSPRPGNLPDDPTFAVATTTPSFTGFPLGVTSGSWHAVVDLTLASSYNASFITAFGGTPALAEAGLLLGLEMGVAYLNIHTAAFPGGEIRGAWTKVTAAPVPEPAAWSLMIAGFATAGAALRRRRPALARAQA